MPRGRSTRSCVTRAAALAAVGLAAAAGYRAVAPRFRHWGATGPERDAALPGDEIIDRPSIVTTRAVTVDAPPEAVWPWLVQMGQDRAGLYSYDWLENLVGLDFHNADRIVPEWQRLAIGDQIRLAPAQAGPDAGFTVASIEPTRWIVAIAGDPARVLSNAAEGPLPVGASWAFVLEPLDERRTRLIVRLRARMGLPGPLELVGARLLEPVHFVMERKQLLGIKARAED
jgi:hypothetical protein